MRIRGNEIDRSQTEEVFDIPSQHYLLFIEQDDERTTNGLNRTQFKNFVSVILSTITHSKRVIRATVALFREISTPQEPVQSSDEYLREIIKLVANVKTRPLD